MNVYAIKAYENTYGGLHGINKHFLMAGDYKTAEEEGLIASHEVMESYSEFDSFYEEAENEGLDPGTEEFDEYVNELQAENTAYEIYKLNITEEDYNKRYQELESEFYNNPDKFLKQHQDKESNETD